MHIILSQSSSVPIYEQIVMRIRELIMHGELKEGDAMPSIRQLARDLHVSIITTQRAYEELARDGLIRVVPAKGAYVSETDKDKIRQMAAEEIRGFLQRALETARQNGIREEEVMQLLKQLGKES